MGPVLWPKSVTRSFWKRRQVTRYLTRTFPEGAPKVPAFDFTHRRLVLVAGGPRSSTGYGVRIVRITEKRSTIGACLPGDHARGGRRRRAAGHLAVPADHDPGYADKRVNVQWQGRP